MRNFTVVGIIFLLVGLLGCGGGESGTAENSGSSSGEPTSRAVAIRAQVESSCPTSSESDFCSRAYRAIARWVAGEITDEEFVNQIVAIRGGERTVPAAGSGEQSEPPYDVEEFCTPKFRSDGNDLVEVDYDSAWEALVNIRQRGSWSGQVRFPPNICHYSEGDRLAYRTETLRIYSYNPDGTSYQNIWEVISKWECVENHRGPVTLVSPGSCSAEIHKVNLFFRESLVPSLLERYDGMTRSEIVEDLVRTRLNTWDFVNSTTYHLAGASGGLASCADLADRDKDCLPSHGSPEWWDALLKRRESNTP